MMRIGAALAGWLVAIIVYLVLEMQFIEAVQGGQAPTVPDETDDVLMAVCGAAAIGMAAGAAVYAVIARLARKVRSSVDFLLLFLIAGASLFDAWSGWLSWNGSEFVAASDSDQFGNGFAVHFVGLIVGGIVLRMLLPDYYAPEAGEAEGQSYSQSQGTQAPPPGGLTAPLKALLSMLALMAKADGVVRVEELQVIQQFLKNELNLSGPGLKAAQAFFQQAKTSPTPFAMLAKDYARTKAGSTSTLTAVLLLLVEVASADGEVSHSEKVLLEQAAAAFGLSPLLKRVLAANGRSGSHSGSGAGEGTGSTAGGGTDSPESILGVAPGASADEIRRAYLDKVQQYHPDKVSHLGPKLRDFAEAEFKRVNAAYEHLKARA